MDRRGNHIPAGCPLAKIEDAAAVGAEGKVGGIAENDLAARGAEQAFGNGHRA